MFAKSSVICLVAIYAMANAQSLKNREIINNKPQLQEKRKIRYMHMFFTIKRLETQTNDRNKKKNKNKKIKIKSNE